MEHTVDPAGDRQLLGHVGDDELEAGHVEQMVDVVAPARAEVVDRDHLVAARQQRLA